MQPGPYDDASRNPPDPEWPALRRVLAFTNFSRTSEAAVRTGAAICRSSGADLYILHAASAAPVAGALARLWNRSAQRNARLSRKLAASVASAASCGARAVGILAAEDSEQTFPQLLDELQIDFVVVGSRPSSLMRRLSRVATPHPLRSLRCPVIQVGKVAMQDAARSKPGPIVFATDFHETSSTAALWAAKLSTLLHAELHCIHVLPSKVQHEAENTLVIPVIKRALRELMHPSDCELRPVFNVAFGRSVPSAVLDYSRDHNASAIVLGSRRNLTFADRQPSQTETEIVASAVCPVVTVPWPACATRQYPPT
jgi:nucleotide-binding universal stress UspA family protein